MIHYRKNVKYDHDFNITIVDVKIFIRLLMFFSFHTLPCERDYWSEAGDLGIFLN